MSYRRFRVELVGLTPLIMDADHILAGEALTAWRNSPEGRKFARAGDDRVPAWTWLSKVNYDPTTDQVAVPSDNLMTCFMEGGNLVPRPGKTGAKSYKAIFIAGASVMEPSWPIAVKGGRAISYSKLQELWENEMDFAAHERLARELGFELFIKRAKPPKGGKQVRVRPFFVTWSIKGHLNVIDNQLTTDILSSIIVAAGQYRGLGNWRPGCPKPGSYGTFRLEALEEVRP